ncbi:MAG: Non-motile and phage-resistance protein [Parcubacteria group bacterium ADurb.Bin316]|nr:MAG: Non-motile and phage-resistance protein [Parcubacteria group bacterium ADurb.Bin316]
MISTEKNQVHTPPQKKNYISKIIFLLGLLVIILGGISATVYVKKEAEYSSKEELAKISDIASAAVNPKRLTTLQGNDEDLKNPDYQRLKEQLVLINKALKTFDAKWIYLIKNENEKWFFAVDPLDETSPDYTPPGEPYEDYPKELDSVFTKETTVVIGPYSDQWGEFISAFSPIKDLESGKILAVLGVDIETKFWRAKVWESLVLPIIISLFVLILWIVFFVYRDKRIKNEKEIKSREDRFRSITEAMKDVVFRLNSDGKIIYISPAAKEALGFSQEEMLGRKIDEFASGSEHQKIKNSFERLYQGSSIDHIHVALRCKDGKKIQTDINVVAIRRENKIVEIQGVVHDITLEKEREEEIEGQNERLKKSQEAILNILEDVEKEKETSKKLAERLKLATQSAGIGIFEWDISRDILTWDMQIENLFGNKRKKLKGTIGTWTEENIYPEDKPKVKTEIQKALQSSSKFDTVYRAVLPNKSTRYIRTCAAISRNKNNNPIKAIGVSWDVTHEMEVDKAKTEFVSLASHQLRTPLSAINWYAEMLINGDAGKLSKEQKQYVQEIYNGNQRMVELVNSLLNVSRLELGTFSVEPELLDIKMIAEENIKQMEPDVKKKKIKLSKNYSRNLPKMMLDKKLTNIIIQNILSNAIKYTPEKGKVNLAINREGKFIKITVSDTGLGIPINHQTLIFSKLFRADNVRETDTEGTGLGLYIIKSIVDNVGGKINFTSEQNKGTTFNILIPLTGMIKKEGTKTLN